MKSRLGTTKNIGLVFSGGGSRGAYQIGVWKALQELGIANRISAVAGTSVGAINGAAFVQNDLDLALELWGALNYTNIFSGLTERQAGRLRRKEYWALLKGVIQEKGLNVDPLKSLLKESLKEDQLRSANRDFGLVVYNLTKRKPMLLRKDEIDDGKLIDFIIASATFPIFQPYKIDDAHFIDGGIYDNRPLNLLIDIEKVDHIICIDVTIARHIWPYKGYRKKVPITYLRPSRLLGSPMAFRNEKIRRNMQLGYDDTMYKLSPEI